MLGAERCGQLKLIFVMVYMLYYVFLIFLGDAEMVESHTRDNKVYLI